MKNQIAAELTGADFIDDAVMGQDRAGKAGLWDKAFALAFRGLVYAQIWEDPVLDMEGLEMGPGDHVMTIASGGCNALSYLTADPARVSALDLNTAHIALGRLKVCALNALPNYTAYRRFFRDADSSTNVGDYHRHIAPHLDPRSREYWEARDLLGRTRIKMFAKGVHRFGLLGLFIAAAHAVARLHGSNPKTLLQARTLEDQRRLFERDLKPLFKRGLIRFITNHPAALFGLGIPPAQFEKLAGGKTMADVLCQRLEKLCCDFPLADNYFAWQALGRGYERTESGSVPPYLERANFDLLRERADRLSFTQGNVTEWLANQPAGSVDKFLLLDAQDWMDDTQLNALWSQICRTAGPNARVLFRTAHEPSLLPGRVAEDLLDQWDYREEQSRDLTRRDRSSIYGGVHLYVRRA